MAKQTKKGFTLIELLVVVAIIGLLATMVAVSLTSARSRARDARRVSDIRQIENALELYYAAYTSYPVDLKDLLASGGGGGYINLSKLPTDPQGRSYCFAAGKDLSSSVVRYNFYHIGTKLENVSSDFLSSALKKNSTNSPAVVAWDSDADNSPCGGADHSSTTCSGASSNCGFDAAGAGVYDRGVFP